MAGIKFNIYICVKPAQSSAMTQAVPILLDSITDAGEAVRGGVVVCGSHGGLYPAYLASRAGLRAVIFNDAGRGLEDAGIAGVIALADVGVAAAAVSHLTCRIGDATDSLRRGRIGALNRLAGDLGLEQGEDVPSAVEKLKAASFPLTPMPPVQEARRIVTLESTGKEIVLLDSASLVTGQDAGRIVITGSHGGLVGADPKRAIKAQAAFAVYNDAGTGCEDAGISRLAALDARGIAAATLAHNSARIGDAASAFETGVISALNEEAKALNIEIGESLKEALAKI